MADYDLGDVSRISVEFANDSGLVDPGQVRVKVRTPEPKIKTYIFGIAPEVVKISQGKYEFKLKLDKPGGWRIRWEGNNSNEAAEELSLQVDGSVFYDSVGVEKPDTP